MYLHSAVLPLSVLKLKHCQMNHESYKHPRNTMSEADPLYMNCVLSCQRRIVSVKHGSTCRKLTASLQMCLKPGFLLFDLLFFSWPPRVVRKIREKG